jgi:hypothetical protein
VEKDTALGQMMPGKTLTVKFFGLYKLNHENLISSLKLMQWPSQFGVTQAPKLGGSEGQKAAFMGYISAINSASVDTFVEFYHDEVVLSLPRVGEIKGREEIKGFYKLLFEKVRERLSVKRLIADDEGICADLTSTFTALRDVPDFSAGAMKKGDSLESELVVSYELKDGLIYRIHATRKSK